MIAGIGIDLVEIKRISNLLNRHDKFPKRILTKKEYSHFQTLSEHRQLEFLAGRYAAKEALSKALGTGIGQDVSFKDMEILPDDRNKPVFSTDLFSGTVHVSISHSKEYAIAQVVLEKLHKKY
jgi:holo-[acyl-carrier protein] synthase